MPQKTVLFPLGEAETERVERKQHNELINVRKVEGGRR